MKRAESLPRTLVPRGLSRMETAAYLGVSASVFDAGLLPGKWSGELVSLGFANGAERWRNEPTRKRSLPSCVK